MRGLDVPAEKELAVPIDEFAIVRALHLVALAFGPKTIILQARTRERNMWESDVREERRAHESIGLDRKA